MQRLERDGLLASPRSALGSSMRWENYGAEEAKEEQVYVGRSLIGPPNPFTLMPTPGDPITHTQHPYVTGTSVLGLKYKDGVLIAADTAGSYGSTTRYKSVERLKAVSNNTLLGATGEISDFQALTQLLDRLIITDAMWDDGNKLGPLDIHNFLTRVMYNRRNKFDPLWNSLILGGVKNGQKYLGSVSMIGVHFVDEHIATGFGIHLAQPIFRSEWKEDMTLEEGKKLLEKALLVLFYRDRSAINKIQVANITEDIVQISRPYALKPTWNFKAFKNPTASAAGSW